jgi:Translation elongation factor P (EF-P)/translation initiation factor 5A (eIF-5A)
MKISTNHFKNGTKLIIDNAPCSIIEHEFHKPGKGQAVMRVKYKNLLTGNTNDKTFKSRESVESAHVSHKEMEFLYKDNDSWHFLDKNNFQQIEVNESHMGNASQWLVGQKTCEGVFGIINPFFVIHP